MSYYFNVSTEQSNEKKLPVNEMWGHWRDICFGTTMTRFTSQLFLIDILFIYLIR